MHHLRPQFYYLASGLFNQPDAERIATLHQLVTDILAKNTLDNAFHTSLKQLETVLHYDDDMQPEYSRLFVLATPRVEAQPFGSYWLEENKQLMGETTVEIKKMMAEYGIVVTEQSGFLPDHITIELEFMAFLVNSHNDISQSHRSILLKKHLSCWIPPFLETLRQQHPSPFYVASSDFLTLLLKWDLANP